MSGIFDLDTPAEFFGTVRRIYDRYQSNAAKDIEDLLYVLMGLNHLREWIAPGYNHKNQANRPEEKFYNEIWNTASFKIVNSLCNRTKHLNTVRETTSSSHNLLFDDWPDIDAVRNFDLGPASKYLVDGKDVTEIIDDVIAFYKKKWFERE
jgi:hypothetical protein